MSPLLNNRELATTVWAVAFTVWALRRKSVRQSVWRVITSALNRKIVVPFVAALGYAGALVLGLYRIGLWTPGLIKDTIFWFLFTGIATAFGLINSWKGEPVVRHLASDAFKIAIIVEFLTGAYTLSLPVELALMPLLALLGVMLAVAESKPEFVSVKNILQWIVIVLSVLIVGAAVREAIADWQNLRSFDSLRSFVIAPLLSLLFAPFVYGLLLYSTYENLFARLSLAARDDKDLQHYARRRLLRAFWLRLSTLRQFSDQRGSYLWSVRSKPDFDAMLNGPHPPGEEAAHAV